MTRTVNLGILAHVDAGKTSLTERLLYAAGVIAAVGSVDHGDTQTDTLALERQRGITIKAAVVSFRINDDVTVNLVDTPGHPDFIAEVERVLRILDGAVLVISAVEGVQAQTRVLLRTLQRLKIPTLMFVNKIDRGGAEYDRVLRDIAEKLTPAIIPMGSATNLGTRGADFTPFTVVDSAFCSSLAAQLAEHDDALLAAYIEDEASIAYSQLRTHLIAQTAQALVHPVFFGSAITGAGVGALSDAVAELLPGAEADPDGPLSATVFKVERGPAGEKIAYVRMFSGTLKTRDRLTFDRDSGEAVEHERGRKITAISVFDRGSAIQHSLVQAGQIGKLWGLADVQIGDSVGDVRTASQQHFFAPPTLETAIRPLRPDDRPALHVALTQLAEQDPLINLRQDDTNRETFVSLYGEVQKEVIEATLANDYNLEVHFRSTTTICVERPVGSGAAGETLGAADNPFCATVAFRVQPAPLETGLTFRMEVADLTSIPIYIYKSVDEFQKAMEHVVLDTLQQGLHGWRVIDCTVIMTHSGYIAPTSTSGDFRKLAPLALMRALEQAGTRVCEPIHHFRLEGPLDTLTAALRVVTLLRAVLLSQDVRGSTFILEGEIQAGRVNELLQQVPRSTRGEGVLEYAFARYAPVDPALPIPKRARTGPNPLNRKEYLAHLMRRV
ncbi:MAG TPA: translation factor GTPase family protein [Chloroflexota bacterium]